MRLALEVFGLELALTFGPVDQADELEEAVDDTGDEWLAVMRHRTHDHNGGSFDPAPAHEPEYVEPDERARRSFGFGNS
jgi:hypothetical protein